MATKRRRTIWMADDQWEDLRNRAQNVNESPSRYLAALVSATPRAYIPSHDDLVGYARGAGVVGVPEIDAAIERGERGTPRPFLKAALPAGPITREDVDDLYGGVAPPGREVLEPSFVAFNPVPKPGRK